MNELLLAMNAMPENITINDLQINKGKDKEVLHHIDTVYDKAGDKKYEICVVGMGGAGTIAALVLEKSGMTKVTGIVRSKYTVVEKEGIRIESVDHGIIESWKPTRICKDADEAAFVPEPENSKSHLLHIGAATPEEQLRIQYDYVVVCTKAIPEIENVVRPLITSGHTAIFLIQNGIDIELPFIEAYLNNPMASIVTTISSFMEGDRIVKYVGPDENKIGAHYHSGVDDDRSAHAAKEFFKIYKAGGSSNCILSTWIQCDRWKKLLWNASFNPVCTVLSMNVGEVHDSGAREALILPIMQVIQKLTKKTDKIHLDNTALMRHAWRSNAGKDYRPSMLLDRENGRVMEIEAVLGNAIRRANKIIKVPVPMMTMMYNLLKVVQWNIVKPVPSTDVEQQVIASFNAAGCEPI